MSTEKGYSNSKKYGRPEHKTVHNTGGDSFGAPVIIKSIKALYPQAPIEAVTLSTDNTRIRITITGHGASKGDRASFVSGDLAPYDIEVLQVIDANNFTIYNINDNLPSIGDMIVIGRYASGTFGGESLTTFIKDGANQNVTEDSSDPSKNSPMPSGMMIKKEGVYHPVSDSATPSEVVSVPVKIMAVGGTNINITSGDINIQSTDIGPNFDSMRIGDGSGNYIAPNADGSINTSDEDALTELQAIQENTLASKGSLDSIDDKTPDLVGGKVPVDTGLSQPLTDTQLRATAVPVSVASLPLPTGAATEAKQDTGNTTLGNIDTKLGTLNAKDFSTAAKQDTGNNSLSSIDSKFTTLNGKDFATAAKQDAQSALLGAVTEIAPATDTASSGLNGRLQRIAQRLSSLISLFPTSLGQKSQADSLPVVLANDVAVQVDQKSFTGGIVSARITVGTGAVRCRVSNVSAPSSTRKKLLVKPSKNNTGSIFIGGSTVTVGNGLEIIGPDTREFNFDASDYYMISDTAGQTVEIVEVD